DAVQAYKPSPAVYELGIRAFGLSAGDILFVSSNAWDVSGAKAFGYRCCWCNRLAASMERLGVSPDLQVRGLAQIPPKLGYALSAARPPRQEARRAPARTARPCSRARSCPRRPARGRGAARPRGEAKRGPGLR